MLEAPDLQNETIIECLQTDYDLTAINIEFLPLGADLNTAVYRIESATIPYFLKLRSGEFDEPSVTLPKFLFDTGVTQIIPPRPTKTGQLWANLGEFKTILCPFVDGKSCYEVQFTDDQWRDFGIALKQIHSAEIPASIRSKIKREEYSLRWCKIVKECLLTIDDLSLSALPARKATHRLDPIANELAAFLQPRRAELHHIVGRTERLAQILRNEPHTEIVCHADLHAGNLLLGADGSLYIVDWDTLVIAPKERDLMYIGGGLLASGKTPSAEEALFYEAYGATDLDPTALAYYRYARIIEDIAIYCEELLLSNKGGPDRPGFLRALKSNFDPNGTIELARRSDPGQLV